MLDRSTLTLEILAYFVLMNEVKDMRSFVLEEIRIFLRKRNFEACF